MRKVFATLGFLAVLLPMSSLPAKAQTPINLSFTDPLTTMINLSFDASDPALTISKVMTGSGGVVTSFTVSLPTSAIATGFAIAAAGPFPLFNPLTITETAPITMTLGSSGLYTPSAGNGVFHIQIGSGASPGVLSGVLSIGDFSFNSMPPTGGSGFFNTIPGPDFALTGGSFCTSNPTACAGNEGWGRLSVTGPVMLADGGHLLLDTGTIRIPPRNPAMTPEPTSMLLFGTGLLLLGAALRRRGTLRQNPADS